MGDNAAVSHTLIREKPLSFNHTEWQILHTWSDAYVAIKYADMWQTWIKIKYVTLLFEVFLLNMPTGSVHAPYRHILCI